LKINKNIYYLFFVAWFFFSAENVFAQTISLPSFFSDNMVLQQKTIVTLWGKAPGSTSITVKADWQQACTTQTDSSGNWNVALNTPSAGGPYHLSIKAGNEILLLKNILIGEVWLCSGQSNMEMPLKGYSFRDTVFNASAEIKSAHYPEIRMFTVKKTISLTPTNDCNGSWKEAISPQVEEFSATAYFFGEKLYETLKVPIGLIHTSWEGTPIEAWMSAEALQMYPEYKSLQEDYALLSGKKIIPWLKKHDQIDVKKKEYGLTPWSDLNFADSSFSQSSLEDFEWPRTMQPLGEAPKLDGFNGAVWFRKTVDLPESWNAQELILRLPVAREINQLWINGVELEQPYAVSKEERSYKIPGSLVKAGKLLVAIRIIDRYTTTGKSKTEDPVLILKKESAQKITLSGYWRFLPVAVLEGSVFHIFNHYTRDYLMPTAMTSPKPVLPSLLYNTMIHPLASYKIKGFIWYQGESNITQADRYDQYLKSMVDSWRKLWQEELPFYFVQIAPYQYSGAQRTEAAALRGAQWKAQRAMEHTGMAVTLDIGDLRQIHPCRKKEVGERLALWALVKDYHQSNVYSGPSYRLQTIEGNKIRLEFDCAEKGLIVKDDSLSGFEIAGADKQFISAYATIEGQTVVVYHNSLSSPLYVRYAWRNGSKATLFNKNGLPAGTFTTEEK